MSHNDLETVATYEENRSIILAVKEKYQGVIGSRLWCRALAERMFAPYGEHKDAEYYFPVMGEVEGVTITEDSSSQVTLSRGDVCLSFYVNADLFQIICEAGVLLPKTDKLSYGEKLEVVHCHLRPFAKKLEGYFTLEEKWSEN